MTKKLHTLKTVFAVFAVFTLRCQLFAAATNTPVKTNAVVPAARALPRLLIESLDGPVTTNELAAFKNFALALPLPVGNHGNNLVYGRSHQADDLLATMYEITGDRIYLNRLIEFSDAILACRNNTSTGDLFWTGKREATWASGAGTANGTNYLTTQVESGAILEMLAHCSQIIIAHKELWNETVPGEDQLHLGKTYIERARSYIRESNFTIDSFILPWSVKTMTNGDLRLYFSDAPELKRLEGRAGQDAGKPIPWNQQFMLVRSLVRLADAMQSLHTNADQVALYDKISQCSVDWFESTLHKTNIAGETAFMWSYTPSDPILHYIENSAHGSSDVEGMYVCYKSGRYGISEATMRGFANTALLLMNRDGKFTSNVGGYGGFHGLSTAWMCLAEFRPELYKLIAEKAAGSTTDPRLARILKWKSAHNSPVKIAAKL
jgi:hypothetical protein